MRSRSNDAECADTRVEPSKPLDGSRLVAVETEDATSARTCKRREPRIVLAARQGVFGRKEDCGRRRRQWRTADEQWNESIFGTDAGDPCSARRRIQAAPSSSSPRRRSLALRLQDPLTVQLCALPRVVTTTLGQGVIIRAIAGRVAVFLLKTLFNLPPCRDTYGQILRLLKPRLRIMYVKR